MIAQLGPKNLSAARLAAKNLYQLFQFEPHLMNELLTLVEIHLRIVAGEAIPGSSNGESLFIQQASNLPNDEHILALVVASVAAALDRLQLRKFLLPIAKHVRFDAAQVADLTNGEVALARYGRQFAIVAWFQHTPRREPSVFGPDGM
jgi:hypothetical protein